MPTPEHQPASDAPAVLEIDDEDLIGQADWVIGGDAGRKGRRQAWYAAYVATLGAGAYGFPVVQAAVQTTDPAWLRAQLSSPLAVGILGLSIVAVFWSLYSAGNFRGPVVPPLPWIDHVVGTPMDRALTVRRWWRLSVGSTMFAGALTGATLGAGVAFAGLMPWYAAGLAIVIGAAVGRASGALWLWGQVRSWPGPDRGPRLLYRPRDALRALHAESLRTHSANTSTIGGSVLAGNLRTARLQLARPVRHARRARLRASGPFRVIVRRDLLGMRRLPSTLWSGLAFTVIAATVLVWAVVNPAAPMLAITVGLVPAYLGYGAWAEGLRLQADNAGTPSLLGISPRAEASAHLVAPTALMLLALLAGVAIASRVEPVPATVAIQVPLLLAVLTGGHLLAAFRGTPPGAILRSGSGPVLLILWYLSPGLVVIAVGSLGLWLVRSTDTGTMWAIALAVAVVGFGFVRVQSLTDAHRI
ncbi:MAG: complement resistance protein TraT [Micrococcales bacterium]|nr:complement resistance protein TraT [Micrococcales bacterium]